MGRQKARAPPKVPPPSPPSKAPPVKSPSKAPYAFSTEGYSEGACLRHSEYMTLLTDPPNFCLPWKPAYFIMPNPDTTSWSGHWTTLDDPNTDPEWHWTQYGTPQCIESVCQLTAVSPDIMTSDTDDGLAGYVNAQCSCVRRVYQPTDDRQLPRPPRAL